MERNTSDQNSKMGAVHGVEKVEKGRSVWPVIPCEKSNEKRGGE